MRLSDKMFKREHKVINHLLINIYFMKLVRRVGLVRQCSIGLVKFTGQMRKKLLSAGADQSMFAGLPSYKTPLICSKPNRGSRIGFNLTRGRVGVTKFTGQWEMWLWIEGQNHKTTTKLHGRWTFCILYHNVQYLKACFSRKLHFSTTFVFFKKQSVL